VCDGGQNQLWEFVPVTANYYNVINMYTGECLEDHGYESGNGATVDQWTCGAGSNMDWTFSSSNPGWITNANGLVLEVRGSSTANGASVDLWTNNGSATQQWDL